MTWLVIVAAILLAAYLFRRASRGGALAGVGRQALDGMPDGIRLQAVGGHAWRDAAAAESATEALAESGFQEAGTYRIPELPGMTVRLLANPEESLYAAVCEHLEGGFWIDIFARYQDHTSVTFTTSRPSGLAARRGHPVVHATGADAFRLCERALAEMPEGALRPVAVDRAVHDFEADYAESIAWRKAHGLSPKEIADIARRRAA